jgi:hypothetical protein
MAAENASDGDIRDNVKSLCAIRAIDYDTATVNSALDSALAQRRAKARAS